MSPVRFTDTINITSGGGPNPTDDFSIKLTAADTVPAVNDATSFAFTFPDALAAPTETARLAFTLADTVPITNDNLVRLDIRPADTVPAVGDASTFVINFLGVDTVPAVNDAAKLAFTLPDTAPAVNDARTSRSFHWLNDSAGANVTNPANANGPNDGALATLTTVALAPATETLASDCGDSFLPAGALTPLTAIYRGWFRSRVTLATSTTDIFLNSNGGLFADITIFTNSGVASDIDHLAGTFTFDLIAAGINTVAEINSVRVRHRVTDAAAGVTPCILDVDAGRIELTGVL